MPAALIALLVFILVAVAAFALGSALDQRNARARLIKDRLANERKKPYTTLTGYYTLHTMSRIAAAGLDPSVAHTVELQITAGSPAPVRLLGVTYVGVQ